MPPLKTTLASRLQSLLSAHSVNTQTVFDATSLSKPVVAWAALQLADAGVLDLDQPVCHYARRIAPDDAASALITARHRCRETATARHFRKYRDCLESVHGPAPFSVSILRTIYSAFESIPNQAISLTSNPASQKPHVHSHYNH